MPQLAQDENAVHFYPMGSHLALGDRQARLSGGECANICAAKFPHKTQGFGAFGCLLSSFGCAKLVALVKFCTELYTHSVSFA